MIGTLHGELKAEQSFAVLEQLHAERFSCRGFLSTEVSRETQEKMFGLAQRTASWCNSQPWKVHVTSGAATERFRRFMLDASATKQPQPDFQWPREYAGV